MTAPIPAVEGAAETQGCTIRGRERGCEPQEHQETTRRTTRRTTTAQQVRDRAQETTPGAGGGREVGSQVSKVTWDDCEPARLVGLAYIIGDFTDILSSVRLRHVGEGEHLHVGTVNA